MTVAYKEDLDPVIQVMNELGEEIKADPVFGSDLLTTPKVERVDNLEPTGIELKVLGDTMPIC